MAMRGCAKSNLMAALKTVRVFPYAGLRRTVKKVAIRSKGKGLGIDFTTELANEASYLPGAASSFLQNATTGTLSSDQVQYLLDTEVANNAQAATNPVTGQVNQVLLNSANADAVSGVAPAATVSNVSSGSWLANLVDSLQGTYNGTLGLPGTTPPLGTATTPVSGGTDWTSILETVAIVAAAAYGIYLLVDAAS